MCLQRAGPYSASATGCKDILIGAIDKVKGHTPDRLSMILPYAACTAQYFKMSSLQEGQCSNDGH